MKSSKKGTSEPKPSLFDPVNLLKLAQIADISFANFSRKDAPVLIKPLLFPCLKEGDDDEEAKKDGVAFMKEGNIDSLSSLAKNEKARRQHI